MREEILRIVAREYGLDEVPAPTLSLVDLDADSIDLICVVGALEERFGFQFPLDTDALELETVGDIVRTVEKHAAGREGVTPRPPARR